MAIEKTTKLKKIEVYPGDTSLEEYEPFLVVHLENAWDDPDDEELPIVKQEVIRRGRRVDKDGETPTDDLPELARNIARMIWRYD